MKRLSSLAGQSQAKFAGLRTHPHSSEAQVVSGRLLLEVIQGDMNRPKMKGNSILEEWFNDIKPIINDINDWLQVSLVEDCKILAQDRQVFRTAVSTIMSNFANIDYDDATPIEE